MAGDNDWLAVVGNLGKAQKSWGRLSRVLGQEGVDPKVLGNFYKAVAQVVLLFGAETWVLTQREVPRHLSIQVREEAHREAAAETYGWELGLPASGGGTGGIGARGDKEVGNKEAEHGSAIYCDVTDSIPM